MEQLTTLHYSFLIGSFLVALAAVTALMRWSERRMKKHELDASGWTWGLYVLGLLCSLFLLLRAVSGPLWDSLDLMLSMGSRWWDLLRYFAFMVGAAFVVWLILMRTVRFLFKWIYAKPFYTAVKDGGRTPILVAIGVLLFLSGMVAPALERLMYVFVPVPDLPVFQ
ncbi:MAG: hypothetical protein KDB96_04790 [Flavobacteriales bacterium]|nr:hypothetical protein [Flavobacteriales bacterium]MCB0782347.1 hypothetical protein [Flavobacteriales bacterium]MCB0784816.1 hypothetical protein [Flavobacteriales bacterium]MCB0808578.1 hypothetical protein [Flavobacteriales bacterium]MCB0814449.1 hypothetical protein [Flavobacteriales bacterium]